MNPIYDIHESLHLAAAGPRALAAAAGHFIGAVPDAIIGAPALRMASAGLEMFERLTRRYAKPGFGIETVTVEGVNLDVAERIVWERPFCKVIRFERIGIRGKAPKLLVVAPMSGHHATLVRSTIKAYLPTHDVYVSDWADASTVPLSEGRFGFDDYVDYVVEIMEHLAPNLNVMAICQPSVPVLVAVSVMEAEGNRKVPRSMTLIGGPIDTRNSPTEVNRLAVTRGTAWFRENCIAPVPWTKVGAGRRVYPGFLQLSAFVSMNADRHAKAHLDMFNELAAGDEAAASRRKDFYDEYFAVGDLTEEFYIETVDRVFVRHDLPNGRMTHWEKTVDPSAIRNVRLMTIEGENDDITGIGQTKAAHDLCPNIPDDRKIHLLQPGVGHYGLFSGSRFRGEIVPQVLDFLKE